MVSPGCSEPSVAGEPCHPGVGGIFGAGWARLLVQEAHHRIANSLLLVANPLWRGGLLTADQAAADLLDRAVGQVMAIAEVQRALSRSAGQSDLDLRTMLEATAVRLAGLRPGTGISVTVEDLPALQPQEIDGLALIAAEVAGDECPQARLPARRGRPHRDPLRRNGR